MSNFKCPPSLKPNDTIAIIAPGGFIEQEYVIHTRRILNKHGFKVIFGDNLFKSHHQFAGTDEERTFDFQKALYDDSVNAILCARGGYGSIRVMQNLEWEFYNKTPKWICGFSDITIFHSYLSNQSIQSIHSWMPVNVKEEHTGDEPWLNSLISVLKGETYQLEFESHMDNTLKQFKGKVVGGNLSILYSLLGTPLEIDTEDKILFIEDVSEHYYHVDRMLQSFRLAGKLDNLKGILVGSFTDMKNNKRPFGLSIPQLIKEAVGEAKYPLIFNIPAGHREQNYPLIIGREIEVSPDENKVVINWE
ncbi:MAG: LD-carboxypeptidase [Bacteroidales bacterium]|nr:LD-carboxypeptidase [Bacteroidales bacterium]